MIAISCRPSTQACPARSRIETTALHQPPAPRRRQGVRGRQLMAVHDSTLMCGFDLTPVVRIASDRHGRYYPVGLRRGRLVRLDRHSSRHGYYCGMIHAGDDPRAAAERGDLALHYLAQSYLFDEHGYCEVTLGDALDELDLYPITGGWGR